VGSNWLLKVLILIFGVAVLIVLLAKFSYGQPVPMPTTIPAIPVIPVTPASPPGVGDTWTPAAVYGLIGGVIVLIAVVLLPALVAYKKATQVEVRIVAAEGKADKAEVKADAAKDRADQNANTVQEIQKQNERQQGILDTVQQQMPSKENQPRRPS